MSQLGAKHWRWHGGRANLSNGYIGIKMPEGHHLRMKNGYAYEHQLIAEQKIGRELKKGEIVHHINGDKKDNRPENLEVVESIAIHKEHHRTKLSKLRKSGENNPMILCACGCGEYIEKYDSSGRPRKYKVGHSWRKGRKGGWK